MNALFFVLVSNISLNIINRLITQPTTFFFAWVYEPLTILQRSCETLAFSELLDIASCQKDALDRMAFVAAFGVSGVSGTERYHTNFNPVLGETFEYVDDKTNFKFISETVSHHPPIFANNAINDNFIFWQNARPKTKFLGNALNVDTQGSSHLMFPKTKDYFWFKNPASRVHNILLGKMWIEHYGQLKIENTTTGHRCIILFQKCGWLRNKAIYDVQGYVTDKDEKQCIHLYGKWNESITGKWLVDTAEHKKGDEVVLWTCPKDHYMGGKYNLTRFAARLNELDDSYKKLLPPTDSRLRPDRQALERGDPDAASAYKRQIETKQREERAKRKQAKKEWSPTWFKPVSDPRKPDDIIWVYKGNYWELREDLRTKLANKKKKKIKPYVPEHIIGSACDFTTRQYSLDNAATPLSPAEEE